MVSADRPKHIMISYSSEDLEFAARVEKTLKENDHEVWRDKRDIEAGAPFVQKILRGLEGAYAVIVLVSPASAESQWVEREVNLAIDEHKEIIPLLLRGDISLKRTTAVGFLLSTLQWFDIRNLKDQSLPDELLARLLELAPEVDLDELSESGGGHDDSDPELPRLFRRILRLERFAVKPYSPKGRTARKELISLAGHPSAAISGSAEGILKSLSNIEPLAQIWRVPDYSKVRRFAAIFVLLVMIVLVGGGLVWADPFGWFDGGDPTRTPSTSSESTPNAAATGTTTNTASPTSQVAMATSPMPLTAPPNLTWTALALTLQTAIPTVIPTLSNTDLTRTAIARTFQPSATIVEAIASITEPTDETVVAPVTVIRGSYNKEKLGEDNLWVFVRSSDGRYYPQGVEMCNANATLRRSVTYVNDRQWVVEANIGTPETGSSDSYELLLVIANPRDTALILSFFANTWCPTGSFDGLTSVQSFGLQILQSVQVTRQ